MFDIGFSELIVIAIVALVVIGPERLPKVARTAGHLLGRLQRYVHDVKSDISREMQLDELKKMQADIQDSARSFERSISSEIQSVEQSLEQTVQSTEEAIKSLSAPEVHAEQAALVPPESTVPVGSAEPGASIAQTESVRAPVKT
jgi:sec-independent protein translocase protein TatB